MKRYVLSALAISLLMISGARSARAQFPAFNDADTRELQAFQLNDGLVDHYRDATIAYSQYAKAHAIKDPVDDAPVPKGHELTLTEMANGMAKAPQFEATLRSKGITPRQYIETMIILTAGLAGVDMEREGQIKVKPSPALSAANLQYIKQHHDHLEEVLKSLASLGDQ